MLLFRAAGHRQRAWQVLASAACAKGQASTVYHLLRWEYGLAVCIKEARYQICSCVPSEQAVGTDRSCEARRPSQARACKHWIEHGWHSKSLLGPMFLANTAMAKMLARGTGKALAAAAHVAAEPWNLESSRVFEQAVEDLPTSEGVSCARGMQLEHEKSEPGRGSFPAALLTCLGL